MIYTPSYFDAKAHGELVTALVQAHNFGTLVIQGDSEPLISHIPFIYDAETSNSPAVLTGHLARPNQQARLISAGAKVTAIFQGPHAYISPRWYAPAPDHVPTWNYGVVHMHGRARALEGEVAYKEMRRLVKNHDPEWPLVLSERDKEGLMHGILVFAVDVQRIDAKFKLSQNRTRDDQNSVMLELEKGSAADQEVARLMSRVLTPLN